MISEARYNPHGLLYILLCPAVIDGQCIGCGLCVSGCPSDAIELLARATAPEIPASFQEMGLKAAQEKGRIEGFLKLMQK